MATSTGKKTTKKATADTSDSQAQLKEIQQLLFGEQMAGVYLAIDDLSQQNQKQFSDLNKQIMKTIELLKISTNKKFDDFSKHMDKLGDESKSRDALLEDEASSLQQELNAFQQLTESNQNDLEKQLFSEADKLAADMEEKHSDMLEKLGSASGDLSESKTDKKTLAALLVNMAASLENNSK